MNTQSMDRGGEGGQGGKGDEFWEYKSLSVKVMRRRICRAG